MATEAAQSPPPLMGSHICQAPHLRSLRVLGVPALSPHAGAAECLLAWAALTTGHTGRLSQTGLQCWAEHGIREPRSWPQLVVTPSGRAAHYNLSHNPYLWSRVNISLGCDIKTVNIDHYLINIHFT